MGISPTADQLAGQLEEQLLSSRSGHGEKLPSERALAQQFGVGRPLVREVLRRLQERGLITSIPGKGTFVRQGKLTESSSSVELVARRGQVTPRHLIAARSMLEAQAAELAAHHRTADDLVRMAALLDELEASGTLQDAVDADVAFHEAVAIASANPVVQIMFGSIRSLVRGIVIRSLSDPDVRHEGLPSHREILAAIEAADPDAARTSMISHLELARRYYGKDLDLPLSEILERTR